eukprot:s1762_g14.t1
MGRQDDGKGDFDAATKLEELRVNAGIKGMAWLEEQVDAMKEQKYLRNAAQETGATVREGKDWLRAGDLRKDGGKAALDAAAKLEELRANAGIKGMAWLQEELKGMKWDKVRKVAQETGATLRVGQDWLPMEDVRKDHDAEGLVCKLEQLRTVGLRDGKKGLGKVVPKLEDGEVHALSAAAGLRRTDGSAKALPAARVRLSLVGLLAPQAMRWVRDMTQLLLYPDEFAERMIERVPLQLQALLKQADCSKQSQACGLEDLQSEAKEWFAKQQKEEESMLRRGQEGGIIRFYSCAGLAGRGWRGADNLLAFTSRLLVASSDRSRHCWVSTASSKLQWTLPDCNRDCQILVDTAGLQATAGVVGPVGTVGLHLQVPDLSRYLPDFIREVQIWALPDFIREVQICPPCV